MRFPTEYKTLERRCDALRAAHQNLLKIAKTYGTESYDYPTNINESLGEFGHNIQHSVTFWASQATKGTNLPKVEPPAEKQQEQKKTLNHALSRAAAGGEGFLVLPRHSRCLLPQRRDIKLIPTTAYPPPLPPVATTVAHLRRGARPHRRLSLCRLCWRTG